MEYSLNQITSIADCDAILSAAALNKTKLQGKKIDAQQAYDNLNAVGGIAAAISATEALTIFYQNQYDALPEGPEKRDMLEKLQEQQLKHTQLLKRRDKYGIQALLAKEFAITCIDQQLTENDAYIAALEERKGKI